MSVRTLSAALLVLAGTVAGCSGSSAGDRVPAGSTVRPASPDPTPTTPNPPPRAHQASHLPLGAPGLPETRHTRTLAPGVTLTVITRGTSDASDSWTVQVSGPHGTITSRTAARRVAARLRHRHLRPRVERVRTPRVADYGGLLGYRVRVGRFPNASGADRTARRVESAGLSASAVYTGWDDDAGAPPTRGRWHLDVLRIDPHLFRGTLTGSYGHDLYARDLPSTLARDAHAIAAVNGGFFVLDPASGAPGDPAGVGVYGGRLESEPTSGRPALVLHGDGADTTITRLRFHGTIAGRGGRSLNVAGLNRVPGKIRNCGEPRNRPTTRPQQDVTCTVASEIVAFDRAYGRKAPAADAEVVLGRDGTVRTVARHGGARIPRHGRVIEAIGSAAAKLVKLARLSSRLTVRTRLVRNGGSALRLTPGTTVVNGGPLLLRNGRPDVTPRRDGMVHRGDPSFYYAWAHERNPRTCFNLGS